MVSAAEFIAHYASQYYDPQKAHDYYVQNRQLKGKQGSGTASLSRGPAPAKAAPLSAKQREGLSYAKNQIASKKQNDLTQLDAAQKARLDKIQKDADAAVSKIGKTLDAYFAKIGDRLPTSGELKRIKFMEKQASITRKRVATGVRDAVKQARESYRASKQGIQVKYKSAAATEEQNIRAKVR